MIGFPSLASTSMEQGRRAACHALDYQWNENNNIIPIGIYAMPELASVGLSEEAARKEYTDPIIGYAEFKEVARVKEETGLDVETIGSAWESLQKTIQPA